MDSEVGEDGMDDDIDDGGVGRLVGSRRPVRGMIYSVCDDDEDAATGGAVFGGSSV